MTEPTLYPESGFRRLRIDLAYDGTNFSGWAIQPDRRTVQEVVETALSTVAQSAAQTIVAGRTDAGVHASGQVIHVDLPETLELEDLVYKLNRILDEDVRINAIEIAPVAFHARFSALRRYYEYRILDENKVIQPLARLNTAPWYRPLDVDLMNRASALLLGTHNYAAFCKYREGATTIRTLETYQWRRDEEGCLVADVVADAFCYSMVRNLVGAIVCVADGRKDPEWISTLLEDKERVSDSLVFPARGLTLYKVDYPDAAELLERAKKTVARREEEDN
ncbi:MAG: tRNA pseudouridine(38-40) synthase TruA [Actinobacteria bacterium]|nr:tRNA pseudouridine(38-40) synthase TruA [Actinomycetota bacterium]